MNPRAVLVFAALAYAAPLAAQDVPRGPTLLRVAASSDGVVLSLDSATIARTGDSTFTVDAVYHRGSASDREVETQELDCAHARYRGRHTTSYRADLPLPADPAPPARGWLPVGDDELPIFQAICGYLLGSFAASLPVTSEGVNAEEQPELTNRNEVAQLLSRAYPRTLRDRGIGGSAQVRVLITPEGRVDQEQTRVLWATRREFADAALFVVLRMRFKPARAGGRAVPTWVTLPVTFALRSATTGPLREPEPPSLPPRAVP